jgi:sulfite reductase (NADPH) flavoprotein alpha-component
MDAPFLQVENSPFNVEQVDLLNRLASTLARDQWIWLSGYLSGVCFRPGQQMAAAANAIAQRSAVDTPVSCVQPEVTVLYGSQTGNAMRLAGELSQRLGQIGFRVVLSCMSEFIRNALRKSERLLVIVSTHGEGEPPDKARLFFDFLFGQRAPRLENLRFSVLALGDLSYKQFCEAGKSVDRRLEELGARRLHERFDCDVDYREQAEEWMQAVVEALRNDGAAMHDGQGAVDGAKGPSPALGRPTASVPLEAFGRERPFPAQVLENFSLNGRGSDKETRFLKLALEGSGFSFEPGDSLGIYPQNRPELVDQLIGHMRWDPRELVPTGKAELPLREALLTYYEITLLTKPLLQKAAAFSQDGLADLVGRRPEEELFAYLPGRDLLDLAHDFSLHGAPARDFVRSLRRIPPRLYSISSSCTANPDEVDLTVAVVRYRAHDRDRFGTCSIYCAEQMAARDRLSVYVNPNPNFRMPPDPSAPLIMVGAGTGVAPFRAFIEERAETGAGGKTWLFFGDRRFRTDFLYQLDWLRWRKQSALTRMDVAFSRDAAAKVYVQHRMLERGRDIYAWLQEGAYFFVCGDEKRLAPDVHAALATIVRQEGGMNEEQAQAYLADMRQQNRYQRDVY